jgi:hypothetical protein
MTIEELRDSDIGRHVIYRPLHANLSFVNTLTGLLADEEAGVITSWNSEYIFVRYTRSTRDGLMEDTHSKATNPRDLRYAEEDKSEEIVAVAEGGGRP